MKLSIKGRGMRLTQALEGYIQRRAEFAISRFGDEVRRVTVWVSDLNGPRKGVDKECKLQVALVTRVPVVLAERDSDLYQAIDRIFDRAGQTISRQLDRRRERLRLIENR